MNELYDCIGIRVTYVAFFYGDEISKSGILKSVTNNSIKVDQIELPFFDQYSAIESVNYKD